MIFASVGTHQDGFPRMLSALERLGDVDLVVQHGHGHAPANARAAWPFLSFPEMVANFDAAERVITHAGVGSILLAIRHGHVPVVVPRLKRYGEHVDDHQVELVERLVAQERVLVAWEAEDLPGALLRTPPRGPRTELPRNGLHDAVRSVLRDSIRVPAARAG